MSSSLTLTTKSARVPIESIIGSNAATASVFKFFNLLLASCLKSTVKLYAPFSSTSGFPNNFSQILFIAKTAASICSSGIPSFNLRTTSVKVEIASATSFTKEPIAVMVFAEVPLNASADSANVPSIVPITLITFSTSPGPKESIILLNAFIDSTVANKLTIARAAATAKGTINTAAAVIPTIFNPPLTRSPALIEPSASRPIIDNNKFTQRSLDLSPKDLGSLIVLNALSTNTTAPNARAIEAIATRNTTPNATSGTAATVATSAFKLNATVLSII